MPLAMVIPHKEPMQVRNNVHSCKLWAHMGHQGDLMSPRKGPRDGVLSNHTRAPHGYPVRLTSKVNHSTCTIHARLPWASGTLCVHFYGPGQVVVSGGLIKTSTPEQQTSFFIK